jgi:hypothetical protein
MTSISEIRRVTGAAAVFPTDVPMVVVHNGPRGPRGFPGDMGDRGPQGPGITVLGPWTSGATYRAGDAVTARSSAAAGVQSLWVQRSSAPGEPSTTEPHLDPARWDEIGATDLSNITGAIWTVYQLNHGFQFVGTPVCFSLATGIWEQASNRLDGNLAVALVREIISPDLAVLQASGEIPNLDPRVIFPGAEEWEVGKLYYTSNALGRLQVTPPLPTDVNRVIQPILIPTRNHLTQGPGDAFGVVLPWRPAPNVIGTSLVPARKFFFTATAGQTVISGDDLRGNQLAYTPGDATSVFVGGLNLNDLTDYVATDGVSVVMASPLTVGAQIEIWTPSEATVPILPSTAIKLDTLEPLFDGARTTFPLTFNGGTDIVLTSAPSLAVHLDGFAQEPLEDFTVTTDGTSSQIEFPHPPALATRFWAVAAIPTP